MYRILSDLTQLAIYIIGVVITSNTATTTTLVEIELLSMLLFTFFVFHGVMISVRIIGGIACVYEDYMRRKKERAKHETR